MSAFLELARVVRKRVRAQRKPRGPLPRDRARELVRQHTGAR